MQYTTRIASPVGQLTLASDGEHLNGLWIAGQKYHGDTQSMQTDDGLAVFSLARQWLERYFAGLQPAVTELPLAPAGSAFRQGVWDILCCIPYGETRSYGEIAREMAARLGKPSMSAQAAGGAVGHNPISIIIPCHRALGANGSLTGYAGGLAVKRALLELEGVPLQALR